MWRAAAVRAEFEGTDEGRKLSAHKMFWMKHYPAIPAFICFYAALNTLSRAGILLAAVSAMLLFLHAGVVTLARLKKAARVRTGAFCALVLVLIAVAASIFMPEEIKKEVDTLQSREVLNRMTGRQEWHARVSVEIFKDHLLFGCGGWGYQHFSPTKVLDKDGYPQRSWGAGSANVHNDYLQFLAEHGLVVFLLLAGAVVLLLLPVARTWRRLSKTARFLPARNRPPAPQSFFALPGAAFAVLTAAALPLVHAFGDCPLRSPAVLTLYFTALAAVGGFLPREPPAGREPADEKPASN
jgi:O-antigen ligase